MVTTTENEESAEAAPVISRWKGIPSLIDVDVNKNSIQVTDEVRMASSDTTSEGDFSRDCERMDTLKVVKEGEGSVVGSFENDAVGVQKITLQSVPPGMDLHTGTAKVALSVPKGPVLSFLLKSEPKTEYEDRIHGLKTETEDEVDCRDMKVSNSEHTQLKGTPIIKNLIESQEPLDTIVSCLGGKIGAHRLVLAAASPFIAALFQDHRLGEMATLILPDISVKIMEILIEFCYTGEMMFPKLLEPEVFDAMRSLMIGLNANFSMKDVIVKVKPLSINSGSEDVGQTCKSSENHREVLTSSNISKLETNISKNGEMSALTSTAASATTRNETRCNLCSRSFSSKGCLLRHVRTVHQWSKDVPLKEFKLLQECVMCNKRFDTVKEATQCLADHKFTRCLTCLGVFPSSGIDSHFKKAHGYSKDTLKKCRWCGDRVQALYKHACLRHFNAKLNHSLSSNSSPDPIIPVRKGFKRPTESGNKGISPQLKSRKLDENGNPIQLARRTGVPVGKPRKRNVVLPNMKFHHGTYELHLEPVSQKIVGLKIEELPKVYVHLESYSDVIDCQNKFTEPQPIGTLLRNFVLLKKQTTVLKPEKDDSQLGIISDKTSSFTTKNSSDSSQKDRGTENNQLVNQQHEPINNNHRSDKLEKSKSNDLVSYEDVEMQETQIVSLDNTQM